MTEQDDKQSPEVEQPASETPARCFLLKGSKLQQIGFYVAIGLVLLAIILLLIGLTGHTKKAATVTPTVTPVLVSPQVAHVFPTLVEATALPEPTSMPATPTAIPTPEKRNEVITYTIADGDTVASIAEKFGLWPETILWANRYELGDDLRAFSTGKQIFILPVDGLIHVWTTGEGLNAVGKYYGVNGDVIVDCPFNQLDRASLGSFAQPNIPAGTHLVVPGGTMPGYFASDTLLHYAAIKTVRSLPLGTPETYSAPRTQIIVYEVQKLDSIFSIAEAFDLEPETILWANRYLIGDTPDGVQPGEKLIILPSNGVYHAWLYGEGLNAVSRTYQVDPAVIVNEPLNHIDASTLGDYSLPRIKTGTFLFVPGGKGSSPSWVDMVSVPGASGTVNRPNVSYLGAFSCTPGAGLTGSGLWKLPTGSRFVSGYEWNPPVHNGVDYGGAVGNNIYASDSGVVIYAGWSDRGYGNTIVVDHGNGYLTLYGHLMEGGVAARCGDSVYGGDIIGYMGSTGNSTGPHLHFEIRYNGGAINPHDFGL